MKLITLTAAAIALTTTSAFAFGAHQRDGFRDTGCDPEMQTPAMSERTGELLHWMNPSCPPGAGATDTAGASGEDEEENENGNGNGSEENGNKKNKKNASWNNNKGGNYDWTGHDPRPRGRP